MKKERPILFSTPMVQAILEGRKTQTRRICNPQLPNDAYQVKLWFAPDLPENTKAKEGIYYWSKPGIILYEKLPYGLPGDILWVRETHYRYWVKNGLTKTGKQKWKFISVKDFPSVRFMDNPPATIEKNSYRRMGWYKRSSLFMPKEVCRIKLEIVNIRVERLQEISEQDAAEEGVKPNHGGYDLYYANKKASIQQAKTKMRNYAKTAKESFQTLWQKINGPESWDENPWVWVIEFKIK